MPATIAIVVFWRAWLDYGDDISKWLKRRMFGAWKGPVSRTDTRTGNSSGKDTELESIVVDPAVSGGGLRPGGGSYRVGV